MNERLVEDWLNKASERAYQIPFAQSLIAEGMQVLRVGHSPHEHGKDIIAIDKKGKVHAYQLKDGNLTLTGFQEAFGQINALVETPVEHPAITGKPPHKPWLVISGDVTNPAEDRIRVQNEGWKKRRLPSLSVMVGKQLLVKFINMAQGFWPDKPEDSRSLLSLYLAEGRGCLDRKAFSKLIRGVVTPTAKTPKTKVRLSLAAANLFASYALSPFYTVGNHWELVQGWTITAAHIAWAAEKAKLKNEDWVQTFRLAVESALTALDALALEALTPNALGPSTFNEIDELTRARCTICAGVISVKVLLERWKKSCWEVEPVAKKTIEDLFKNGRFFLWGESAVPFFLAIVWALDKLRADQFSDLILLSILSSVAHRNRRGETLKLNSPYDSADEVAAKLLRHLFEKEKFLERQSAASYTLDPLVTLVAGRLWRNRLAAAWGEIAQIDSIQIIADKPRDMFLWDWGHERGSHQSRRLGAPQSWRKLLAESRQAEDEVLPATFKAHFDFKLLFLLCYPHRLSRPLVKHLEETIRTL